MRVKHSLRIEDVELESMSEKRLLSSFYLCQAELMNDTIVCVPLARCDWHTVYKYGGSSAVAN